MIITIGAPITSGISKNVPPTNKFIVALKISAIKRSRASRPPTLNFASKFL